LQELQQFVGVIYDKDMNETEKIGLISEEDGKSIRGFAAKRIKKNKSKK